MMTTFSHSPGWAASRDSASSRAVCRNCSLLPQTKYTSSSFCFRSRRSGSRAMASLTRSAAWSYRPYAMWKSASASGSPCSNEPVASTPGVAGWDSSRSTVRGASLRVAGAHAASRSPRPRCSDRGSSVGLRSGKVSALVSRSSGSAGSMANGAKPSAAASRRRRAARTPSSQRQQHQQYPPARTSTPAADRAATAPARRGVAAGLAAGLRRLQVGCSAGPHGVAAGSACTGAGGVTSSAETSSPEPGARRGRRCRRSAAGLVAFCCTLARPASPTCSRLSPACGHRPAAVP